MDRIALKEALREMIRDGSLSIEIDTDTRRPGMGGGPEVTGIVVQLRIGGEPVLRTVCDDTGHTERVESFAALPTP